MSYNQNKSNSKMLILLLSLKLIRFIKHW